MKTKDDGSKFLELGSIKKRSRAQSSGVKEGLSSYGHHESVYVVNSGPLWIQEICFWSQFFLYDDISSNIKA